LQDGNPKTVRRARSLRKKLTPAETILWSRLRRRAVGGAGFRKQHPIGPYIADFACVPARLVIEVDGDTHGTDAAQRHDRERTAFMQAHGWRVLRLTNEDVHKRLDGVLEGIGFHLHEMKDD
jgi:very-short-patch-repair endonuclease